ncbi:MAG: transglutaminase-like domain-containing protein [Fimbriimonadaceae bacterium]|nr:transglutaminase-like domain-containing protein [Fimbriimonadaceae bacterium]
MTLGVTLAMTAIGTAQPAPPAGAQYFGLFMKGEKIGYTSSISTEAMLEGRKYALSDSTTLMDAQLIGANLKMRMDSKTWTTADGSPYRMKFRVASSGLVQNVDAYFRASKVDITVDNIGKITKQSLAIPKGAPVLDDPLPLIANGKIKPGKSQKYWILDPMTVAFIENEIKFVGTAPLETEAGSVNATVIEIVDPRITTKVYLTAKGDFIKAVSGMGIEIRPISREVALGKNSTNNVDIATNTRVVPTGDIANPRKVKFVTLRITGPDLSSLKTDDFQTVTKQADGVRIDIHPPVMASGVRISTLKSPEPTWLAPSLNIPSDTKQFRDLARTITGGSDDLNAATKKIHRWVNENMQVNAGLGVLRNAAQVLESKEGVCRDHAILTTTLMRAAKIPSRLAGGMIYAEGAYYYHAWCEVWDGSQWVAVDTTLPEFQASAAHLKLSAGNVDKAFAFKFLENARVTVIHALDK